MPNQDSIVAVLGSHTQAEAAVKELQRSGFDMHKLSILGKDSATDDQVVGYYNMGDRLRYCGRQRAFWGGLWGRLFGSAFFWVPGVGPLLVAGPMVSLILDAAQGETTMGDVSSLGAALCSVGIAMASLPEYETALKGGKLLLICHGTPQEILKTRQVLDQAQAAETALHAKQATAV